ncbi:PREDICTED: leukemia inhibitory factor-like [Crocodylus porosus]|uniref:Leukemia inhibitory factor n=1 Tax=Crocodylus porosus TaxID=8502 RepID=A0A7M4EFU6_CROPO|nr:PREDICTED: leukemia inhibitory factor-like [Crocodylus porosus]
MKFIPTGVASLLLVMHFRLVAGKALPVDSPSPLCEKKYTCSNRVFEQIRKQVILLNGTAQELFNIYVKWQGDTFRNHTDKLCNPDTIFFPAFHVNQTSEKKEIVVALYKIFAFLNASLGNITRDQEELNPKVTELLERLNNTTKTTRGLMVNLSCLLCTRYNVSQVDVIYGESTKGKNHFKKKQQGCQVLAKYVQVIAKAAQVLLPHVNDV